MSESATAEGIDGIRSDGVWGSDRGTNMILSSWDHNVSAHAFVCYGSRRCHSRYRRPEWSNFWDMKQII